LAELNHADRAPAASVFAVTGSRASAISMGTAFAIGRGRSSIRFATCAHVIREVGAEGLRVGGATSRIVSCGDPDGPDDLAIIEADEADVVAQAQGVIRPLSLGFGGETGEDCVAWGFAPVVDYPYPPRDSAPLADLIQLRPIRVRLGAPIRVQRPGGPQVAMWQLATSEELPPGLSGSPVIEAVTDEVIGVASIGETGARRGMAIAAAALEPLWPAVLGKLFKPHDHRGLRFVPIPRGGFTMGTSERRAEELMQHGEVARVANETSATRIVTRSYHISRYPVSNAQYARFVEATGHVVPYRDDPLSRPSSWDPVTRQPPARIEDFPVVLVTWHDATAYCRWLGGRLPTEAEWEKAARGPDGREWPWGDVWDSNCCNTAERGLRDATPVGAFSPAGDSPYGVADMSGNVWEWCNSAAFPYPYSATDGRESPAALGPRVLRGGAWGESRYQARCASRNNTEADDCGFTVGFRVVLPSDSAALTPEDR
jgi:formylglycine-generating enzyme required for sulfatase activity